MAEYIDKNATVYILGAMSRSADCECIKKQLEKAAKRVSAIPASDVAPVVRCKDCKYHHDCGVHFCGRLRMDCPDDSGFFCSYGERERSKDNEQKSKH